MPGIYIHITFCKKACHYCDFHFSPDLAWREELLESLMEEIRLRRDYLPGAEVTSVCLGGGTASLLDASQLRALLDTVCTYHVLSSDCEITLEANPDDLGPAELALLRETPINRLSIGIQSFFDEDLKWMNRAHTGKEAYQAVRDALETGFGNLTVDLIYGFPLLTDEKWLSNLRTVSELGINHLSCYNLTVEEGTALWSFIRKGRERPLSSAWGARQFDLLMDQMERLGFQHYEISNFCREGFYSRHNTSYWQEQPYLGIGPSAHSYDGRCRSWNRSNNHQYLQSIREGRLPSENEQLSPKDRLNERIMTRLRTVWGLDLRKVEADFGTGPLTALQRAAGDAIRRGWIREQDGKLYLTRAGKHVADRVVSDLFFLEELPAGGNAS